jgi:hypothetical protein
MLYMDVKRAVEPLGIFFVNMRLPEIKSNFVGAVQGTLAIDK